MKENVYTRAQLEAMTDEELMSLEDELLFENETTHRWRIRAAGGRIVNFFFGGIFWLLTFMIFLEPIKAVSGKLSPIIQLAWVIVSGVIGMMASALVWKIIGIKGRTLVRNLMHYWPVTIGFIFYIAAYVRHL